MLCSSTKLDWKLSKTCFPNAALYHHAETFVKKHADARATWVVFLKSTDHATLMHKQ